MKRNELSLKEQDTYDAIIEHIRNYGYPPTVRDLCNVTGVKSTSTIHTRLGKLQELGYIDIVKGANRTIVVKNFAPCAPVRCKACRYHHKTNMGVAVWTMCHRLNMKTNDDFYCAYGEEK